MPQGYISIKNHQAILQAFKENDLLLKAKYRDKEQDWMQACQEIEDLQKENEKADQLYDQATQRIDQLIEQCNKKQAEINQLKKDYKQIALQRNTWKKVTHELLDKSVHNIISFEEHNATNELE